MRLHHVAVIVSDLGTSASFYERILGLKRDERPDLGFPGLFYSLGNGQQLHVLQHPHILCLGDLPHFALATSDLDGLIKRLDRECIIYTKSRSGRAAIFFRDPDGNTIEMIGVSE